jgi:hypothetical protein
MAEITDIVKLYVDKEVLPTVTEEINKDLVPNIQSNLWVGHGYDTGHLHDTIQSAYDVQDDYSIITAWYTADYGKYINDDGSSNHWKGYHFMENGVEKTIALYG